MQFVLVFQRNLFQCMPLQRKLFGLLSPVQGMDAFQPNFRVNPNRNLIYALHLYGNLLTVQQHAQIREVFCD
jgi:hypothetical protein